MTARARLTKRPAGFSYVNVIYIHARSTMPITAKLDEYGKPAWIALIVLGFLACVIFTRRELAQVIA